jgi:hypothetical protein
MKKRDEKHDRKEHEHTVKDLRTHSPVRTVRRVIHLGSSLETNPESSTQGAASLGNADFLSFDDINMDKFTKKNKSGLEALLAGSMGRADGLEDIESRISKKYDRNQYPWLSDFTLKIKDAFLFLHNEILDFVKFIESTPEDIRIRK